MNPQFSLQNPLFKNCALILIDDYSCFYIVIPSLEFDLYLFQIIYELNLQLRNNEFIWW